MKSSTIAFCIPIILILTFALFYFIFMSEEELPPKIENKESSSIIDEEKTSDVLIENTIETNTDVLIENTIETNTELLNEMKNEYRKDYLEFVREFYSEWKSKAVAKIEECTSFGDLLSTERNNLIYLIEENNRIEFEFENKTVEEIILPKYKNHEAVEGRLKEKYSIDILNYTELENLFSFIFIDLFCKALKRTDERTAYAVLFNYEYYKIFKYFLSALNIYFINGEFYLGNEITISFNDDRITDFTKFIKENLIDFDKLIKEYLIKKIICDKNLLIVKYEEETEENRSSSFPEVEKLFVQ